MADDRKKFYRRRDEQRAYDERRDGHDSQRGHHERRTMTRDEFRRASGAHYTYDDRYEYERDDRAEHDADSYGYGRANRDPYDRHARNRYDQEDSTGYESHDPGDDFSWTRKGRRSYADADYADDDREDYDDYGDRDAFDDRDGLDDEDFYRYALDERREAGPPAEPPKKKRGLGKKILILILLILLGLIVYFLIRFKLFDMKNEEKSVVAENQGNILNPIDDDLLFLLAGVDDTGAGTPQRTDTLMLFRLNFVTGKVSVLSVPRDTRAYVRGQLDKINHAHAYGGIDLTLQSLRDFLGLDLDYYIKVDYEMVRAMIDAGGGVQYDVPETTQPDSWETFTTGPHRLDGKESLSYLRHRHSYAMGDIGRVQAQQAFLKEAIHQLISPANFYRYPALLNTFLDQADTNIPMLSLAGKLPALARMKFSDVEFHTLPGEGKYIGGLSYFVAYPQETIQLAHDLFAPFVIEP